MNSTATTTTPVHYPSIEERDGLHYLAGTRVPVALVARLVFELRCEAGVLPSVWRGVTEVMVSEALEWSLEYPRALRRERAWLRSRISPAAALAVAA